MGKKEEKKDLLTTLKNTHTLKYVEFWNFKNKKKFPKF